MEKDDSHKRYLDVISRLINVIIILLVVIVLMIVIHFTGLPSLTKKAVSATAIPTNEKEDVKERYWKAPDTSFIRNETKGADIHYGRQLIENTAYYLGPQGSVAKITNGMNCQNCHLDAGTKLFGNNYSAVASNYPKFRERSGTVETICKRVNDCIERSLGGSAIDTLGREMQAMVAYIKWLGKEVPKGTRPDGAGIRDLAFMEKAADPVEGKKVYDLKCSSCHSSHGEGKKGFNGLYQYPPLWGDASYNTGAGLFRLSRFAGYVKDNMPQGATYENPQLTDEEAWHVAAFVNSQPRPARDIRKDWPNPAGKPVDHPFGPFTDRFPEHQHKYGPFGPIAQAHKKSKN